MKFAINMNPRIRYDRVRVVVSALFITALFVFATSPARADEDEKAEQPSRVKRGPNGETILTLDEETQKTMGLETAALTSFQLAPEVKGYGRVMNPAPLSAALADLVAARATAEASQKELDRLKSLAAQDNASARAVETAEAAAKRDAALEASAKAHLLATFGRSLADRDDLAKLVQLLSSGANALVRVELPAGETLPNEPATVRLVTLGGRNPITGQFIGRAATVDPQTQGQGFLFLIETNATELAPGASVTALLQTGGASKQRVIVPRAAVIRHEGATWVYLETDGTNFIRRVISLGPPLENGWFVSDGVKADDRVVVTGAQTVFSEELNSSGFQSGERD